MSAPTIPNRNREEAINDILESIALEETAIAHIINAEGEKIQKLLKCDFPAPQNFEQLLEFQNSITSLFDKLIQKQTLLISKMKLANSFLDDDNNCHSHKKNRCKDD